MGTENQWWPEDAVIIEDARVTRLSDGSSTIMPTDKASKWMDAPGWKVEPRRRVSMRLERSKMGRPYPGKEETPDRYMLVPESQVSDYSGMGFRFNTPDQHKAYLLKKEESKKGAGQAYLRALPEAIPGFRAHAAEAQKAPLSDMITSAENDGMWSTAAQMEKMLGKQLEAERSPEGKAAGEQRAKDYIMRERAREEAHPVASFLGQATPSLLIPGVAAGGTAAKTIAQTAGIGAVAAALHTPGHAAERKIMGEPLGMDFVWDEAKGILASAAAAGILTAPFAAAGANARRFTEKSAERWGRQLDKQIDKFVANEGRDVMATALKDPVAKSQAKRIADAQAAVESFQAEKAARLVEVTKHAVKHSPEELAEKMDLIERHSDAVTKLMPKRERDMFGAWEAAVAQENLPLSGDLQGPRLPGPAIKAAREKLAQAKARGGVPTDEFNEAKAIIQDNMPFARQDAKNLAEKYGKPAEPPPIDRRSPPPSHAAPEDGALSGPLTGPVPEEAIEAGAKFNAVRAAREARKAEANYEIQRGFLREAAPEGFPLDYKTKKANEMLAWLERNPEGDPPVGEVREKYLSEILGMRPREGMERAPYKRDEGLTVAELFARDMTVREPKIQTFAPTRENIKAWAEAVIDDAGHEYAKRPIAERWTWQAKGDPFRGSPPPPAPDPDLLAPVRQAVDDALEKAGARRARSLDEIVKNAGVARGLLAMDGNTKAAQYLDSLIKEVDSLGKAVDAVPRSIQEAELISAAERQLMDRQQGLATELTQAQAAGGPLMRHVAMQMMGASSPIPGVPGAPAPFIGPMPAPPRPQPRARWKQQLDEIMLRAGESKPYAQRSHLSGILHTAARATLYSAGGLAAVKAFGMAGVPITGIFAAMAIKRFGGQVASKFYNRFFGAQQDLFRAGPQAYKTQVADRISGLWAQQAKKYAAKPRYLPLSEIDFGEPTGEPPGETLQETIREKAMQISRALGDPGFETRLQHKATAIKMVEPEAADGFIKKTIEKLKFLHSKMPKNPDAGSPLEHATKWMPSDEASAVAATYLRAAWDPVGSLMGEIESGRINDETIETVEALHPELFEFIRGEVLQRMMDHGLDDVPRIQRAALAKVFKMPALDPAQDPEFKQGIGELYAQISGVEADQQQPGDNGGYTTKKPINLKSNATIAQKFGG